MSDRPAYLAAAIRLYLALPGSPRRARRADWAVAATLYQQAVPLDTLAHAMRLATLRRFLRPPEEPPLEPVASLAYYRRVLQTLTPEALDPGYIDYTRLNYQKLLAAPAGCSPHQDDAARAFSPPESRGF